MKYKLHRLNDYSDQAILAEIKRVSGLEPSGPLTQKRFRQHSRVSPSTIQKRFGGWHSALEAAGLAGRYSGITVTERMRYQPGRNITRQEVLAELQRVASKLGRKDISVEDFNNHANFNAVRVRSYFKNWWRALASAGLAHRMTSVRYTDEERYENLLRVWTHLGRAPKYKEMSAPPSIVGGKAYTGRWGTWIRALEAFVARVSQDAEPIAGSNENAIAQLESQEALSAPVMQDRIPLGLRYRILVRDKFKCVLCGNSPAKDQSVVLHVDHIVPRSKGGSSTFENLRTLCELCNVGKGNLMME